MFVDSHCHLNDERLKPHLAEILNSMKAAQVDAALTICTTVEESSDVLQLALDHPNLWASAGVHPDQEDVIEPSLEDLIRMASHDQVIAVGETGLDYYRLDGRAVSDMAWQRERFRRHIQAAKYLRKPLVIHTRCATEDTLSILKEEQGSEAGGVIHCFTESLEFAKSCLDLGFYISFSGILTFKNAKELQEVAKFVPLDRCLIETDSPYLAPVPYRGRTNTPAFVPYVAQFLGQMKQMDLEAIAQTTTDNFKKLFKVPTIPVV